MTIDDLLALASIASGDELPVWDVSETGANAEPTKKITINQLAAAVKTLMGMGDPVTVDHGGTGASTAADARTNLSVYSKEEADSAIQQSTAKYSVVSLGSYQQSTANAWENTGLTITVPTDHMYIGVLECTWASGRPLGLGVNTSSSLLGDVPNQAHENGGEGTLAFTVALYPGTWYVFTKRSSVGTSANSYYFRRIDVVTA